MHIRCILGMRRGGNSMWMCKGVGLGECCVLLGKRCDEKSVLMKEGVDDLMVEGCLSLK